MRATSQLATIGLLVLSSVVVASPAAAEHLGTGYSDCENQIPAAQPGSYDVGRVKASGYATGSVAGIDLRVVDAASPASAPDVFKPDPAGGPQHMEVAGALVTLEMPGLANTFLNNGAPSTKVAEDALPLDTNVDTHTGAQKVSMIFNGEATIHPPESFTCESVEQSNLIWTFTIQKIELDGYATAITTADDGSLEPWGLGANIQISPGPTGDA